MSNSVFAVIAYPGAQTFVQPDGTRITFRIRGDENFHWEEDIDGYSIVYNQNRYEYGTLNSAGDLIPSGLIVGKVDPASKGLKRNLAIEGHRIRQTRHPRNKATPRGGDFSEQYLSRDAADQASGRVAPVGTVKNLVVMVRFSNHTSRILPSVADIDILFNSFGGNALAPTGSIKEYYLEASYGQLTLDSDVMPWVTVSNTEAYYANGASGDTTLWLALEEALSVLDATVDFNDYDGDNDGFIDSITFLHSGYGAEWGGVDVDNVAARDRIWSHKWNIHPPWQSSEGVQVSRYHISPSLWGRSGTDIGRIGVIAHETGHFFGLPDLYDTDRSGGKGVGSYGLMANSWGFDNSQYYPPHPSPWSKEELGWITPTVVSSSGCYKVSQAEFSGADYYKLESGYATDEYLMIENRQAVGFDAVMPQGGLVIWHIDNAAPFSTEGYPAQAGWPQNGNHYRVAVLQADGDYDLELGRNTGDGGDVYHSSGVSTLSPGQSSHPNTDGYQNGTITNTGHRIYSSSAASTIMRFCVDLNGVPAAGSISDAVDFVADWQVGGHANFFYQNAIFLNDNDAAQSADIADSQTSYMQTTIDGADEITFDWKVSSQANADLLTFYINNVVTAQISGEQAWSQRSFLLAEGSNVLRWEYSKNASVTAGDDTGWVDQIRIKTTPPPPQQDDEMCIPIKASNGKLAVVCL